MFGSGVVSTTLGALVNVLIVVVVGLYLAFQPGLYSGGVVRLVPVRNRRRAREVLGALGSTLATVLLSKNVALAEGIAAFALLILLQFVITGLSVRSKVVSRLVKSEPALLWHKGEFLGEAMRIARVNESEILAAVRSQGRASMDVFEAVVLETGGSFSVIARQEPGGFSTLAGVARHEGED